MSKLQILSLVAFLLFVTNVYAQANILQTVYQIRALITKNDTASLNEITSFNSTLSVFPTSETGYFIKIFSQDEKVLFNENLGVSFTITLDPIGVINRNQSSVTVKVPYYPTAKSIAIYHVEKKILVIDLSKQFCNNNSICDLGENVYNCPEDCKQKSEGPSLFLYILLIALAILTILILNFIRLRKSASFDSLKQKWS